MSDLPQEPAELPLPERATHSFIVKVWLEEAGGAARPAAWRGHITHVASGVRRYFQELEMMGGFVGAYLETMGVVLGGGGARRPEDEGRS